MLSAYIFYNLIVKLLTRINKFLVYFLQIYQCDLLFFLLIVFYLEHLPAFLALLSPFLSLSSRKTITVIG
jgi:hypothetical protein